MLFSARRSSTIVLSSNTSFSTSESSAFPKELFDWFERLRCSRGVFRDDRWSTSVEWLDELLRSRAWCRREVGSEGDGTLAFCGNSFTDGDGAWSCVALSVGDARLANVSVLCLPHL